jgi:tRNA (cytosine40_48-C5)-methyltransferase
MIRKKVSSLKTLTFAPTQRSLYLATKYGYDEWMLNRFIQFVPNAENLIEKMLEPVPKYIRTNTLKITSKELVARLVPKGFVLSTTILADVFEVNASNARISIGATIEYLLGYYYIQDITSCMAVEALDAQPNQCVLDMTSAPGGKTTLIAQKMHNTGSIVAVEASPRRIRSLSFNLARCGVMNTSIYHMDAMNCSNLSVRFDRILLDAPCSGEGMIWNDVSRRSGRKPDDISKCSQVQKKLFETALQILKPGGIILYSTCSFAPEENEVVVDSMLGRFNLKVEPLPFGISGLTRFGEMVYSDMLKWTVRFYPHIHNSIGFYIARLRKIN